MKQEEWGIKRVCLNCGAKFYDFHKDPIICPQCETRFDVDYLSKKRQKSHSEKVDDVEEIEITEICDDIVGAESTDIESLDEDSEELAIEEEKNI